jgi:hypothetical protein
MNTEDHFKSSNNSLLENKTLHREPFHMFYFSMSFRFYIRIKSAQLYTEQDKFFQVQND